MPRRRTPARLAAVGLGAGLLIGIVGCSDDGGPATSDAAAGSDSTTVPPDDSAAGEGDPYCDLERQIDALFESAFADLPEDAPESEMQDAMIRVSEETLTYEEQAIAAAPAEIADDVTTLFASVHDAADGDLAAYEAPDVMEAMARVDEYCYGPMTEEGEG